MGAKSGTILAAQGSEGNRQQDIFPDHGQQVDLVVLDGERFAVLGIAFVNFVEFNSQFFLEWSEATSALSCPRDNSCPPRLDAVRKRLEMNCNINRGVDDARVGKFEIVHCDGQRNIFRGARPPQQLDNIDNQWLSQNRPVLKLVLIEEPSNILLLDRLFGFGRWGLRSNGQTVAPIGDGL